MKNKKSENNNKPPKLLTDVGLSMFVNTIKLRKLPLPIIKVAIKKLIWHFKMPVWEKDGTDDWNLTPLEVIRKKRNTKRHQKRTQNADVRYPILLIRHKSRFVILDGVHRLVRAYINGEKEINAKIIPRKYIRLKEFQS